MMSNERKLECIADLVKNYLGSKKEYSRIRNNMIWYKESMKKNKGVDVTPEQAFMFVMQSPTSIYQDLTFTEQEEVAASLWAALVRKNYSLTRIW